MKSKQKEKKKETSLNYEKKKEILMVQVSRFGCGTLPWIDILFFNEMLYNNKITTKHTHNHT